MNLQRLGKIYNGMDWKSIMSSFEKRGILCTGDFSYNRVWRECTIVGKDTICITRGTKMKYVRKNKKNMQLLFDLL